jgi:hypothetical protein
MISLDVSKLEINNSSFTPSMNKLASYYAYWNIDANARLASKTRGRSCLSTLHVSDEFQGIAMKCVSGLGFGQDIGLLLKSVHVLDT